MADGEEAEQEQCAPNPSQSAVQLLSERLEELQCGLTVRGEAEREDETTAQYCQALCQTLVECGSVWKTEDDPWTVLECYRVAILAFMRASVHLSVKNENVGILLERLSLSCVELLLSVTDSVPDVLWEQFQTSVQMAHAFLQDNGVAQLHLLCVVIQDRGIWSNQTLLGMLRNEPPPDEEVHDFLRREGPELLQLRVKHLIKENWTEKAALLAKACAEFPEFESNRVFFKQSYLVCLCSFAQQDVLMQELTKVDCRDALEMICNLEADGDENAAFTLCSGFLTRQLLQEDSYCAWELTLFWSKLLKRLEPSEQGFLEKCQKMSRLAKTMVHLLFFIKVIQSELEKNGLSACVEMCIRALRMESCEGANKTTICKTISCLLPSDLEVKRACQLTEFLLEPTVDSYYAVETLYNEPDQKLEEEELPVPNSLRCELLLVFKTQWPFDPEFWDWKTLKRHCLGLMGEEASIVSSIDELNDDGLVNSSGLGQDEFKDVFDCFLDKTNERLNEIADQKQKNREVKKLREKGFVSARFRNWQAYMQYCVLCDKEFLGHRIVRHAQTHMSDGLYICPICTQTFANRETLDPHVTSHVKSACKERLAAIKTHKQLASLKPAAPALNFLKSGELQAKNKSHVGEKPCNGLPRGPQAGAQLNGKAGNLCPVPNCRKSFKYFRNLVAHVKDHGNVEEAKRFLEMQSTKIVCQYCRRHFLNVHHLNDHLQVHCGAKPYTCIQLNCKASFDSNAELLLHSKGHPMFKAKCMFPGCGKIFNEPFKLYDHEAQHYKTFTCKVQGCGQIFHAQSELDQHEDSHNIKPDFTAPPSDPQSDQLNQSIANAPVIGLPETLEISKDNIPANQSVGMGKMKHVIENTICPTGSGPLHTFDPGTCKEEPPDPYPVQKQIPCLEPPIPVQPPLHPPMPHSTDRRQDESLLEALINDPMLAPPCSGAMTRNYQSLIEDLQPVPSGDVLQAQMQTAVSQSHTHPLYDNGHPEYEQYNPDPMAPIQAPYHVPFGNRVVPLPQSSHNGLPAMPQKIPPRVSIFSTKRRVMESRPLQAVSAGPSMEDKERYRCPYETCSRDYSNYRSLIKHMKAAHCEFYTQWKLSKSNCKVPPPIRPLPMNGRPSMTPLQNQEGQQMSAAATQVQNTTEQPHYLSSCPNSTSNYTPMASHMGTSTTQNFPNQMENILVPIVLSELGNTTNQTPVAPHSQWGSSSVNSYQPQTYSQTNIDMISTGHSSAKISPQPQVQGTSNQGGPTYSTVHHTNTKQCHIMPGQPDAPKSMNSINQTGHSSDSAIISCIQQPKTKSFDCLKYPNKPTQSVVKLERDLDSEVPQANVSTTESNPPKSVEDSGPSTHEGEVKKRKRSSRTKWPAIIRDGKFICCRCFREFQSPKSLGGHLSKRAICKPYEETVLSSELPTSFLELLNSPHLSNTPESSPSDHMDSKQSWPLVGKGPLDPKLFPNVTFLHTNESVCANSSKPNADISKQSSVRLETPASTTQQRLAEAPVSYPQDGQSSVIQHTANIKENFSQVRLVNSPQSCKPMTNPSGSSDPLLSRLLDNERSTDSLNKPFFDHADRNLQAKTLSKINEIKERSTISNTSALSNEGLLAAMASLAQNLACEKSVKEKLRDQILAADFNRRNSSGQLVQSSASSSPTVDIQQSHVIHKNPQINEQPAAVTIKLERSEADETPIAVPCSSNTVATQEQYSTLSTQQDDDVREIQKALQSLNLSKDVVDKPALAKHQRNTAVSKKPDVIYPVMEARGYSCDGEGCGYRAMTKDALFKHLVRHHNYTEEMLNQCRKEQFNFAPFTCQLCPKTFTRNSNLRTHYQSIHNYSPEQIVKLGITRHYNKKAFEAERGSCFTDGQIQKSVFSQQQRSNVFLTSGIAARNQGFKSRSKPHFTATLASVVSNSMQRTQPPPRRQPVVWPSVIKPVPAVLRTPTFGQDKQNGFVPRPLAPPQPMGAMPSGKLFHSVAPHEPQGLAHATQQVMGSLSLDKKAKLGRPKLIKPREVIKKPKEKKTELTEDAFSPYRPYRCVHQGCVAAFTIQHNLILHYRAIHQSALPKLEVTDDDEQNDDNVEDEEENEEENEVFQDEESVVTEFLCQVKDCSRIFQTVTDLLQHYLQLHKMGLDRAGAMISTIKLGRFQCDQANCELTFTAIWKYINHVDKDHKETKVPKTVAIDGVFRCEVKGCTLGYSTRSNLLRHIMKKHQELYKHQLMNARRSANGVRLGRPRKDEESVEKENREIVKKPVPKTMEKKKKEESNHWTKYGKPILKSKEEASAMCTKKIPLQYPCMIKGCETVTGSERHLMKHYVQHGLPKQDLEEQRSNYIFCKKMPRSLYRRIASRSDDTEKSDESSMEVSEIEEAADTAPSGSEFSKPTSDKESTEDTEASDVKVSTDSSSVSLLVKRKKGRPRKVQPCVRNRVTRLRAAQSFSVNYADLNSDSTSSSATVLQEQDPEKNAVLTTFKPLGFEVSFIKFLEEESKKLPEKRKAPVTVDVIPRKKFSGVQLKTATVVCNRINPEQHTAEMMKLVEFKNPQKLTSLSHVTFEVHRGLSNVYELLLKQLHDMRPAVIIHKERTAHIKV